ncbi:unnamed protein product [Prorocentrum cordatum]|uniref:Uncharacterized protein n=1 Tax=Prorocentrum cordatum TaxID=2364126 RepID=A0ABN9UUP0_9DINO|nr:unnamed protein product [Polarella glacialis]
MARTRTEKGEGGPPARKAPRKSARAAAAGSDAAFCQRCDEACDKETSLRAVASGRGRQLSIIGCDTCWATYERHYIGEYAWADVCEKSHEEDEFRDDFGKHADADRELEEQVNSVASENGSVEIDTIYGQEVSKTNIQLTPQQWNALVVPRGVVGITPEMTDTSDCRVPSCTQPGVCTTGVVMQHPDKPYTEIKSYTRTEVRMSTVKLSASKASKVGADAETFRKEITRLRQKQATILRGFAKVPTMDNLREVASAKARALGLMPPPPPRAASSSAALAVMDGRVGSHACSPRGDESLAVVPRASPPEPRAPAGAQLGSGEMSGAGYTYTDPVIVVEDSLMAADSVAAGSLQRGWGSAGPGSCGASLSGDSPANGSGVRDRSRSPAPSTAASRADSSGGKASAAKPSTPNAAEKNRLEALRRDLNISELLDGVRKGDRDYSLKRFKPKAPSVIVMAAALKKQVEAATYLAANIGNMTWVQVCERLKEIKSEHVLQTTTFQASLLRAYVNETINDFEVMVDALLPYARFAEEYDVVQPRLSSMTMPIEGKMSLTREVLLDVIVLPQVAEGFKKVKHLQGFGGSLAAAFKNVDGCPDNVKLFCEQVTAMGMLLEQLPNYDPLTFDTVKMFMKPMIELITGATEEPGWHPLSATLSAYEPWAQYKASFRSAASTDLEIAPLMTATVSELVQAGRNPDGLRVIEGAISSIRLWRQTCRGKTKATVGVEQALHSTIDRLVRGTLETPADRLDIDEAEKLMDCMAKLAAILGVEQGGGDDPMGSAFEDVSLHVDIARQAITENQYMETISKFLMDPASERVDDIRIFLAKHCDLKVHGDGQCQKLIDASVRIIENSDILNSDLDLERVEESKGLIDRSETSVVVASCLLKCIVPTPETAPIVDAITSRLADLQGGVTVARSLIRFCAANASQDTAKGDLQALFEQLDSAISGRASTKSSAGHDELLIQRGLTSYETYDKVIEPWCAAAKAVASSYATGCAKDVLEQVQRGGARLRKLAGGMNDGSHWMDGFGEDVGDFAAIMAHARKTLFKQFGLHGKLKLAVKEFGDSVRACAAQHATLGIDADAHGEEFKAFQATLEVANTTLAAAALAQAFKDEKAEGPTRKASVLRAVDALQARGVQVSALPAGLWTEAQKALAL